jgi:thioredoxin 1
MNEYVSRTVKMQAGTEIQKSVPAFLDSLYNYPNNGSTYQITFLEFGAKGCSACIRMEGVMDEIRILHPTQVNVVFLNILQPHNQNLMKYFGVAVIPTQILLNRNGEEFFRYSGFISTKKLLSKMNL